MSNNRKNNSNIDSITKTIESTSIKSALNYQNNISDLIKKALPTNFFEKMNQSLSPLNSIKNIQPILTSSALAELINNLNISFPKIDLLHEKYSLNKILNSNIFFDKSLFKGINDLINSQGFQNSGLESLLNKDINENSILEEIESVDISIKDEIISGKGFNGLSERAREICINILVHILIPIIVSISASYIYDNYIKVYEETKNIKTSTEVKKITRNHNDAFDRKALKDYGVTKVESLNLRFSPSMKSKVITSLQLGTLVYVIDSSNRSWLFVEVKIDNDLIQGWISRRYTSRFK